MTTAAATNLVSSASRHAHLAVPLGAVIILLVLLVPLPPLLLDVLLSFNLMLSVVVLLVAMYTTEPVKFT
ncbi:FHIPEP family type III secretion protein, partial [Escherichia coli]|nr:FHIPEP family type III secretion protein [Escherichia coli]